MCPFSLPESRPSLFPQSTGAEGEAQRSSSHLGLQVARNIQSGFWPWPQQDCCRCSALRPHQLIVHPVSPPACLPSASTPAFPSLWLLPPFLPGDCQPPWPSRSQGLSSQQGTVGLGLAGLRVQCLCVGNCGTELRGQACVNGLYWLLGIGRAGQQCTHARPGDWHWENKVPGLARLWIP